MRVGKELETTKPGAGPGGLLLLYCKWGVKYPGLRPGLDVAAPLALNRFQMISLRMTIFEAGVQGEGRVDGSSKIQGSLRHVRKSADFGRDDELYG
jgi:hypothetical protein